MLRIVSSAHSCVERFSHTLWLLLVSGVMAEACSEATFGGIASSSGIAGQSSADADTIRLATERLQAHLQSLPVAKRKVAPFLETRGNEMKVVVSVGIAVVSVLNINDAQQTMTSRVSIDLRWHDKALSWNTSDYDGVGVVEMPVDSIWVPHVYITNSLDTKSLLADTPIVNVYYDGSVQKYLDRIVETTCVMDLEKYPYDTQNCPLLFHHLHPPSSMELCVESFFLKTSTLKSLSFSSEWYLDTQKVQIVSISENVQIPSVSLKLRRKTTFYTVCLVLPMMLTSFMNTLVFLVPLQSGEKVSFLVSIFVSTSVFVSFFKDVMPRGLDSVPATMKLLIGVVVQSLLVLLATLFVMSRDRQQDDVITSDAHPPFEDHWEGSRKRRSSRATNSTDIFVFRQESTQRGQAAVGDKSSDTKVSPGMSEYAPPIPTVLAGGDDRRGCLRMTTRSLDRVLFLLAFTANFVFMGYLFADWL